MCMACVWHVYVWHVYRHHGIAVEEALGTLRALAAANGYRFVYLPHAKAAKESGPIQHPALPALVDSCALPACDGLGGVAAPAFRLPLGGRQSVGMRGAVTFGVEHMVHAVRDVLGSPPSSHAFFEIKLTRARACDAAQQRNASVNARGCARYRRHV